MPIIFGVLIILFKKEITQFIVEGRLYGKAEESI